MPRANRYLIPGRSYHLTHRCHNRAFLLRFAKDRDRYQSLLREAIQEFHVSLLNYNITSNHVHLLVNADSVEPVSGLMQTVAGEFAQFFNRRKGRSGGFWEDRFHSTMIDEGQHLWNCTKYVDLNMVRAGAVKHPSEWRWDGYSELMGLRQRYRLLDMEKLLRLFGSNDPSDFQKNYSAAITESIAKGELKRDAKWTETLAVGSCEFIEATEALLKHRRRLESCAAPDGAWTLREAT